MFSTSRSHPAAWVGVASCARDDVFTYFIVHYLPTGVLGVVIAAIFSATMGTLAGSLNSAASTIVNDLYRPFPRESEERHLMRVSRAMTVVWGCVLVAVAIGASLLKDNVVNNALSIAGLASGNLLGLFLLGILTSRVGQSAALVGVLAGLTAVTFARFGTSLAFPWFALVGSATVFACGLAASVFLSDRRGALAAATAQSTGSIPDRRASSPVGSDGGSPAPDQASPVIEDRRRSGYRA